LTGLYLHFNALNGVIPKEIAELSELSDLYLNVNNLSGEIPPHVGNMSNLQGKLKIVKYFFLKKNIAIFICRLFSFV
jgi:hypothetical protein